MKRLFPLLLCLILCGCTPAYPEETTTPAAPDTPAIQSVEFHDGGLSMYPLEMEAVQAIRPMGRHILVLSGHGGTTLTLLRGEDLSPLASVTLDFTLDAEAPGFSVTDSYLCYYDPNARATVVLDRALSPVASYPVPAGSLGAPVLSGDGSTLYSISADAIYARELATGRRRTVAQLTYPEQTLMGLHLEDSVIQCRIRTDGETQTIFLSTDTGQLLHRYPGSLSLVSQGSRYYAACREQFVQLRIFGDAQGQPQLLCPIHPDSPGWYLPGNHAMVTATQSGGNPPVLEYYSLGTGLLRARLTLTELPAPQSLISDSLGYVWFFTRDTSGCAFLYRWEIAAEAFAPRQDPDAVYTYPFRCTQDDWAAVREKADALSRQLGITVSVGEEAAAVQPWDYTFTPEPLPQILSRELDALRERLGSWPSGVLTQAASHFDGLTLCLVRSIRGATGTNALQTATGVQFYQDDRAYVVITTGTYAAQALYHELFHVLQTHILTESTALDQWNEYNPSGFAYSFGGDTGGYSPDFVTGQTRCFVDRYSMSFPSEDRARVFENALLPGNAQLFSAPAMQQKLRAICTGMREAFGLDDHPASLPWEQYLHPDA